jgi:hypothetical protein
MSEESGIGNPGAVLRDRWGETQLLKRSDEEVQPGFVDSADHLGDRWVGERTEDGVFDDFLGAFTEGNDEESSKASDGILDRSELFDDVSRGPLFPSSESGVEKFAAIAEVPVEASFGHAKHGSDGLYRHGRETAASDGLKGRVGPVITTELVGCHLIHAIRYRMLLSIRNRMEIL